MLYRLYVAQALHFCANISISTISNHDKSVFVYEKYNYVITMNYEI